MIVSEAFNAILDWIAIHPGWTGFIIFLTALAESLAIVGMIVPGAILMFGFGALIALGHLEFWSVYSWSAAGAVAGDSLSFWLGRIFHERLRQLWPFSNHPDMLARSEDFFKRHGGKSVLLGRFFGPVRAVIPAVAGMLDMSAGRFVLVNIASALLWAPAYLLPGIAFAASLEIASQVAWRLVVLIVLMIVLLWLTVWVVRGLFRFLHPRVHRWLKNYYIWSHGRPFIGPLSHSLLDPVYGEFRGLTVLAMLLLGIAVLFNLLLSAAGQRLPTTIDQNMYHFLQDLRTPWADNLMVLITELGDFPVKATLATVVLIWLSWQRAYSAAIHWVTVLSFGWVTIMLCRWLFEVQRPADAYQGISDYAFPSNHAALSTILFGFLAVLGAQETQTNRRWIPYLGASLIVVPIAFSRLYLGIQWLTDVIAGISLGLIWVVVVGTAYSRRCVPTINRLGLVLVSLGAVTASMLIYGSLHHQEDMRHYRLRLVIETMSQAAWWRYGWQQLAPYRLDFGGNPQQPLILQWAASRQALERRLHQAGWQIPPPLNLKQSLMWLNPHVQLADLPVLPRVHDGRHEDRVRVHIGVKPNTRWVLRFWDSGIRLQNGDNMTLWLGSLTLQSLERRMEFFSIATSVPSSTPLEAVLSPALQGLRTRTVAQHITLITE